MTHQPLYIYNTITRKEEKFEPLNAPHVGLYLCGPTVYGDPHLGHARPVVVFDVLNRYLTYLGYKVRYVRNITDVGHLESDADEGEDKIQKRARLEKIEPMEIAQYYTNRYQSYMRLLNAKDPSIEPRASGHILEQQVMVEQILANGYAYEKDGSVYFDVVKYNEKHPYGKLSGRVIEELMVQTREDLEGGDDKRNPYDFALWKKAAPEHIMRWRSPWGDGFPGWHLECSVMSTKYLGEQFDIHGGGMDLMFPHHECEIAQSVGATGREAVRYWMHNNMITINGQKMGKSLGNFITLEELFSGNHKLLAMAYSPMTIRFFMLQAHYRSPLDFSNEALQAAEKGFKRMLAAIDTLEKLKPSDKSDFDVANFSKGCFDAISNDINTPVLVAQLFDGVRVINSVNDGKMQLTQTDIDALRKLYNDFVFDILGLKTEEQKQNNELTGKLIESLLTLRHEAKQRKDFATSDTIRQQLNAMGVNIKDKKDGWEWEIAG